MRRPLSLLHKRIITAAILAAVLVLEMVTVLLWAPRLGSPLTPSATETAAPRPVFSISKIDGIADVLGAVSSGRTGAVGDAALRTYAADVRVTSVVLPHHTLAAPQLYDLWSNVAAHADPSVIVIVSPNHDNDGDAAVQTTHGVWATPFGSVETDDALVNALVASGAASDEADPFVNEHGIGTHVSYVAELFPGVPIVPVMGKSPADADDAARLASAFADILPDDALVIASVDFSHYLPADATAAMDAETLSLVADRRYDQIERLHSDHLDSPFAMIAYLLWSDHLGNDVSLVWHDSSHALMGQPNAPGTSYLVYVSSTRVAPAQPVEEPDTETVLTAVGDVMLGRYVATAFSRTTMDAAFGDARSAFAGSDIAFANLESVVTSSEHDTGKEIFFKADPARVDVLQYLGLTHVSVANNHVDDYGRTGWTESVGLLKTAGIIPIGDYADDQEPVFSIVGDKTFAFLAYADVYRAVSLDRLAADIDAAKAEADVVVVSFHWGVEYAHDPVARQVVLAHAAIDAGASVILGHHPHVLQGVETYQDGLILYSLGNFVFDQVGEDENESMVAKIVWNDDGTRSLELIPMRIVGTFPRAATNEERLETFERIAEWSGAELSADFIDVGTLAW